MIRARPTPNTFFSLVSRQAGWTGLARALLMDEAEREHRHRLAPQAGQAQGVYDALGRAPTMR